MYSYGPPQMAEQKQDDQLEHTYSSYVRIRDVDLKTCRRRWTIGRSGERGLGISVLAARHDDDDDMSGCKGIFGCSYLLIYQSQSFHIYVFGHIYHTFLISLSLYIYIYIYIYQSSPPLLITLIFFTAKTSAEFPAKSHLKTFLQSHA